MYYTDPILIYFLLNIQENQLFGEELCVSQHRPASSRQHVASRCEPRHGKP